MNPSPIRIGISRCLLGDDVRFDGGHKRDPFLVEVLGRYVEWVPVCPEVEAGFGVPREPMLLIGRATAPRLVTTSTRRDLTKSLKAFSTRRIRELRALDLSGFVFKARSPSCGVEGVPLYDRQGIARPDGMGLFARAFQNAFPLIPVAEEDHLADAVGCEHFIARVYAYHRRKRSARGAMAYRTIMQQRRVARKSQRRRNR